MDWKIVDENGEFLTEANCQYDCCDLASLMYDAVQLEIDFDEMTARIIKRRN